MNIEEEKIVYYTPELLEESVIKISAGIAGMRKMGLKEDDIITLIQSRSKVTKANIKLVLGALDDLRKTYVKS